MCTADNIIPVTSNHTRLFAMKLFPRCNATNDSKNATTSSRGREMPSMYQPRRQLHHREDDAEMTATPRASGRGGGVSINNNDQAGHATIGANMRRCQSANGARRPRSIMAGMREHSMHKSRSHSEEPTSCHHNNNNDEDHHHHYNAKVYYQTQELPIPARRNTMGGGGGWGHDNQGGGTAVAASSPDKTGDLTRMYDYATWNMYERIVNARRRRLSQLDVAASQQEEESSPTNSTSSSSQSAAAAAGATTSGTTTRRASESQVTSSTSTATATSRQKQLSILLHKNSSNDSSSTDTTMATADETDKSSTTSSSWSRTDSPHNFPGVSAYLMDPHRGVSSCPPPDTRGGDDDHFIFEMDM